MCFTYKEGMAHLKIHGFVQIWSKKTSMAKLKRAVIEIVEGEKEVELVVSSQSGKNQWIFQLSSSASVVLRRRGKGLYYLHLTLNSSASLVVGKLSFTDAKQMKIFLDTFHQSRFPLMKPEDDGPGRSTRKVVNETLLYIECNKAAYRFFRTTPLSKEKPLSVSNSPINPVEKEILKNRGEKRKTILSSLDMNADILKEKDSPMPNKKLRRSHLQHESNKREKLLSLNLQEKHRDLNTVPSFNTNTNGYPNPGETVPSFNTNINGYPNLCETVPSFNTNANGCPNLGETVPLFNTNTNGYPNLGETVPSFNTNTNGYPNLCETVPSFNTNANGYPNLGDTVPSFNANTNGYPNPGETVPSFNTNANGYPNPGKIVPSFNTNANGYPHTGKTVPSFNTNANGYPNPGETVPSFNTNANGYPNPGKIVPSFNTSANGYPHIGKTVPSFNTNANGYPNPGETVPSFSTIDSPLELECIQENPCFNENSVPLDTDPKTPREGFPNLGNTCYMNAVLQSLFAIPSLANDLFTQGIPWENVSNNLIVPFSLLFAFKDISEANTKSMLLLNIKNSISDIAAIFCGDRQHDAHEFLGQCLDQLKEDMKTLNSTWPPEMETQSENSRAHLCAGDATTKVFMCPIVTNFELELQVSIVCRACGQAAVKTELNNYLSINLDCEQKAFPLSLQDYFDLFFIPEVVECHCEKCESKSSVFRYKFRRLPRVLIVHLKRYSINEEWLLVKNYQQVKISKYLSLSSHCDENTKPPLPLESKVSDEGHNVLKAPEMFGSSDPSMKLTTESNDSMVLHTGPDGGGELQIFQGACEGARNVWQQQSGIESGLKLELVNTENVMLLENKLLASGPMVNDRDSFLPMICQLFGIPYPNSTVHNLQQVPEYPDLKNHEEMNPAGESDPASTQLLEDNPKENKMLGGFQSQGVGTGLYQNSAMRNNKEILCPSPPPRVSKLDAQEDPVRGLGRSRGLSLLDNLCSLPAGGSDNSPGRENTVVEGSEAKSEEEPMELQTYRLISVISHIGDSSEGHYISDVYDFQKQAWFLYNDMSVSEIPEAMIQKLRLCDGYIFFYMHNEIFETLLEKAANF